MSVTDVCHICCLYFFFKLYGYHRVLTVLTPSFPSRRSSELLIAQCMGAGVVGRARDSGLLSLHCWNPRDYSQGNYRRVDERPFGGGPGMVKIGRAHV